MRKIQFENGSYYHVYNRGVDRRNIFSDVRDQKRFFQSMEEFNVTDPIGSIYANSFHKQKDIGDNKKHLVNFICYCLNPNHFHFILQQIDDKGIQRFMHKLGTGYTVYFNKRHKRSGALFQGQYKALHVDSDPYFLHLSAYINLNNEVHGLSDKFSISSWKEYTGEHGNFCEKNAILNQFGDKSAYKEFAENSLKSIKERKELCREMERFEYLEAEPLS